MGKGYNAVECKSGRVQCETPADALVEVRVAVAHGSFGGPEVRTFREACRYLRPGQVRQLDAGLRCRGHGVLALDVCGSTVVAYVKPAAPADVAAERLLDAAGNPDPVERAMVEQRVDVRPADPFEAEASRRTRDRALVEHCRALGSRRVEASPFGPHPFPYSR